MSNSPARPQEPAATAVPVRYWWLKRLPVALILLIGVLGLLRCWWGVRASHALEAEVVRIRAAGEPLLPEDFQGPVLVPDEENAALLLKRAADSLDLTPEQQRSLSDLSRHRELIREEPVVVAELLELSAEARALVRQARELGDCDWGFRWQGLTTPVPEFQKLQRVADTLLLVLDLQHGVDDSPAAIESMRDCLSYANHLSKYGALLPAFMGQGLIDSVVEELERVGPVLLITESDPSLKDDPLEKQIHALINVFLEEPSKEAMAQGQRLERAIAYETIRLTCDASGNDLLPNGARLSASARLGRLMLRPMLQLDAVRLLERHSRFVEAFTADTLPATAENLQGRWTPNLRNHSRVLSNMTVQNPPYLGGAFRMLARSRMAAVALAVWLYEAENGELPESLDVLVPEYFPLIPRDPLAGGDVPIGYMRDAQRPFLVCGREEDDPVRFFLKAKSTGTPGLTGTTPAD